MMHTARIPLRWVDQDAEGRVNNSFVPEYLQEARGSLFDTGAARDLVGEGCVVVDHRIEYHRPILFSRVPLEVRTGISTVGGAKVEVAYELVQDGHVVARATTLLCPYDFESQRPRRLRPDERDWMREVQVDWKPLAEAESRALHGHGFAHPVQVRWGDMDRYGHVNNVRFLEYMQEARVALTEVIDPDLRSGAMTRRYVVARQDVDYLAQMTFRHEPYTVLTAPVQIGTSSVVLVSEVIDPLREKEVLARCRVVWVHIDAGGNPAPLPGDTRQALEALQLLH